MKLHSGLGLQALFFSVAFSLISNPLSALALDATTTTTEDSFYAETRKSRNGWGWDSVKTYLGTLGSSPEQNLKIPVLMGVEVKNLYDSWGDARSNGRSHEGIDIMAPKGTPVVSPTKAIVSSIGYGANGGNYVYTINAGGERFYFAHLDSYAPGLAQGQVLNPGDLIGYVGNTGNASGGAPHLHFGIYGGGAQNPFPRLTFAFTDEERVSALNEIVADAANQIEAAKTLVTKYKTFLKSAQAKGLAIGQALVTELGGTVVVVQAATTNTITSGSYTLSRNLTLGSKGEDVRALQKFLNSNGFPVALSGTGSSGNESSYFGPATKKALALYQASKGIAPTSGYFGPLTRAVIAKDTTAVVASNQ